MFRLRTLGPVELDGASGAPADAVARGPKRLALLAFLAVDSPRGFKRRDALAALFWPELDQQRARHALRNALHEIRKALGDGVLCSRGSEEVGLAADVVSCDVVEFDDALAEGRREVALALYRGPFLDGFHVSGVAQEFEHWIAERRDRLAFSYGVALERLAEESEATKDFRAAARHWRLLSVHQPWNGRVVLRLMLALEAAGDRAEALRRAESYKVRLREDLAAEPDAEVTSLATRLREAPAAAPMPHVAPGVAATPHGGGPLVKSPTAGQAAQDAGPATQRRRAWPLERAAFALVVVVGIGGVLLWRQASPLQAGRPETAAANARQRSSIAVLPLKNYSGDPAQDDLAAGMTAELTTTLTKIEALHVVANQSVLRIMHSKQSVPEIARTLGVRHVVDGSVLWVGDRVRITAALVDAATNTPVWSDRFERDGRDVLLLQREVALAVARAVAVALTPADRQRLAEASAVNPDAFHLYIKGTQIRYGYGRPAGDGDPAQYFEAAIAVDSMYAPAYAGLALVHTMMGQADLARALAERALMLDPALADAHMVLGMIRQFIDHDWTGAETSFRNAIRLNPGYAEAHQELSMLLMRRKRFAEALTEAQRTLYLAPMSARFEIASGEVFLYSGQYDEALRAADRASAIDSTNAGTPLVRAYAYAERQRYDAAVEAATQCIALGCDAHGRGLLGYVYGRSDRRPEAQRIVDTLVARWRHQHDRPTSDVATAIARIYVGLGDHARALDWLDRGARTDEYQVYLAIDPTFRSLHAEPRFQALLRKLGLDE
jgi:TolB-like protein/DNA-binding SARP family transcriptional activator/tetratricopeptide (TPR) repeat protein